MNYACFVLKTKMTNILKRRSGQNTVEYLLMLAVVVGVVLIAGVAIKNYMPSLFTKIQGLIDGAAGSLGEASGGG